jgi:hypothetical protein
MLATFEAVQLLLVVLTVPTVALLLADIVSVARAPFAAKAHG